MEIPINIPFTELPEGKDWEVGKVYRVKLTLKQTAKTENGADFTIVDANSMEMPDRLKSRFLTSTEGSYMGK